MVADCTGQWSLDDAEVIFVLGVSLLLKALIPVAIFVYTWKVRQTDRAHHRTSMLGLEETQEQE